MTVCHTVTAPVTNSVCHRPPTLPSPTQPITSLLTFQMNRYESERASSGSVIGILLAGLKRGAPLRRTGIRRSAGPMRRGKALRSRPPVRTPLEDECRELVTKRSGGQCETCPQLGSDMSHRRRRAITPWCPCSLLLQCRRCHEWLHANPVKARGLGWLVRSWEDPAAVTVMLARVGRVQLSCDGSWRRIPDESAVCVHSQGVAA